MAEDIGLSETMLAPTPAPPPPAPPPPRPIWPFVVGALALAAAGTAIAIFALRDDAATTAPADATSVATIDAAAPVEIVATSPEELVVHTRAAIGRGDESALAALLAPAAFGHGIDAGDVATTGSAVAGMITRAFGKPPLTSTWSRIIRDKDVAWIVDELDAGRARRVLSSQLAYREGNAWRIAAWHVAELVRNPEANALAKAGKMPPPAAIADQFDDDHQVHDAFRAAFATPEAFTAAVSDRTDAINLGSAPGERVIGGAAIKRWASSTKHVFRLHDGVAAGRVGDRVGWAAGNVEYTLGPNTQTYRVLAVLVRERDGWRIVLVQWSNGGPA